MRCLDGAWVLQQHLCRNPMINDAGILFSGHTEFYQEFAGVDRVVMMLATKTLRLHWQQHICRCEMYLMRLPKERLHQVIDILIHDLKTKFKIAQPRILVCGLNPTCR